MNLKRFVAYGTCFFLCMVPVAACTAATPADIPIPPTPTIVPPKPTSILPTAPSAQAKPSPRGVFAMAYDSKSNHVILYGGETGDYKLQASYNGETWAFDVATNSWTNMKPASSPNPRGLAELAYDAESDRIILFEGGSLPTHWKSDDIAWAYDFNTNTWKKMNAKGPTGYLGCQMAYDSESDRIILFGGYNISEDHALQATWAYDYDTDTWTEMKPAVNPPGRNLQSMTYDSKSDRIILWGGDSSTNGNPDAPNDESVWAYDFNTNTWEERKATPAPVGRYASAIAYAAGADRTILYGGFQDGSSDMWAYDYNKNAWTELKPSDNPGSISWHEMVYLPETDRLFLFGGKLPNGYFSDKTWLYDYTANAWTVVTPKP